MKIKSVRGTHDLLPESVRLWQRIEASARRLFELYGYAEVRTPIFEQTELFARSIGVDSDIVQKEMYTFSDSKGKSISLRPEGTAPVMRANLEHGLSHDGGIQSCTTSDPCSVMSDLRKDVTGSFTRWGSR